jgi:hypothetical protein
MDTADAEGATEIFDDEVRVLLLDILAMLLVLELCHSTGREIFAGYVVLGVIHARSLSM